MEIDPFELGGEFDIIYSGSSVEPAVSRQQSREKALQVYSLALADPAYQRDDAARLQLFRRLLEALDIKDAASLLPKLGEEVAPAEAAL